MARKVRNTAILAKIQTAVGVDAAPTGAANALLVSNLQAPNFNANNVDRDNVRPYFGASEQLVGTNYYTVGFDIELAGSGTAGEAPAFDCLLRACALAADVQSAYVEYTPITDAQEAVTIYWYDSGVLHKLIDAMGTFVLKVNVGERPVLSFSFTGKYGGITAASVVDVTLTGFKTPKVVTDTNTLDLVFGAAYAAGALTGGTAQTSTGLEVDIGNTVTFTPLVGLEAVDITARAAKIKTKFDQTAANEVAFMADVLANTTRAVSMQHGTVAGNIALIHAPAVQFINPTKEDLNGRRLIGYEGRLVPSAGNDELVLAFK